jgi:hypothetical protein
MVGGVPHVLAYFNPAAGDPYVLAWHGVLVGLWLLGIAWIYFGGGAQFFVDHPGIFRGRMSKPVYVQIWFATALLGGVIGEYLLWTQGSLLSIP